MLSVRMRNKAADCSVRCRKLRLVSHSCITQFGVGNLGGKGFETSSVTGSHWDMGGYTLDLVRYLIPKAV